MNSTQTGVQIWWKTNRTRYNMNPDQQIDLYRMARSIAWSYRLQDYNAAALKDLQRIVDKSKESIVQKFADGLGQEGAYTRQHFQNSLKELERLSIALRNQLGEQLTTSTSRIGSLALKEWGENLSVGGVAKKVNTVALSPEQFAAFFKRNPPAGILIPKVMRNALNQGVIGRIQGELLDVLREGALTGQSYKRIVDKLSESFTDFNRVQLTTLTRTFFQTANAQAFDAVYQANQDIMEGKIWTNVNDDRVCLLCLPLGEVLYKKGESHPPMPRHPNCRCVFRAKTVSYRSLGIDVDELEEVAAPVVTRGYEKNGKWIIPPAGTGTGRRPRAVSFYQGGMKEAFPDLPEAQQKAMLGVGRYNKYKAGELTLDQLADPVSGKLWLLKEIEQGMHLRVPDGLEGPLTKLSGFTPNEEWKIRVEKVRDKIYTALMESSGKTKAEIDLILHEKLIAEITDAKVVVRIPERGVLSKILEEGRIKSQFETGTSKGVLDNKVRLSFERDYFGLSESLDVKKRPIYGTLSNDFATTHASQYGSVQVILKDSVKQRSTFTGADSLSYGKKILPSPLLDPSVDSIFIREIAGMVPDSLDEVIDKITLDRNKVKRHRYMEIQIHDGVEASDIEKIVVDADASLSPAAIRKLEELGIPYEQLTKE